MSPSNDQQSPTNHQAMSPTPVPAVRRLKRDSSRVSQSSTMLEPIDVKGQAILCFDDDMSMFKGTITAHDGSNYSISGQTCETEDSGKYQDRYLPGGIKDNFLCDCDYSSTPNASEDVSTFNVRLSDHDTPMEDYFIPQVHAMKGESVSFCCSSMSFSTETAYRGQRAVLLANQSLGNLSPMSGKVSVLCGPITIFATCITENKKWLL